MITGETSTLSLTEDITVILITLVSLVLIGARIYPRIAIYNSLAKLGASGPSYSAPFHKRDP
jgi:hypothetical protein